MGEKPEDGAEGHDSERTVISPGVPSQIPPETAPETAAGDDAATRIAPPARSESEPRTIIATAAAKKPRAQLVQPGTLINNNYRILALVSAGGVPLGNRGGGIGADHAEARRCEGGGGGQPRHASARDENVGVDAVHLRPSGAVCRL